jgi:hypothetical protein
MSSPTGISTTLLDYRKPAARPHSPVDRRGTATPSETGTAANDCKYEPWTCNVNTSARKRHLIDGSQDIIDRGPVTVTADPDRPPATRFPPPAVRSADDRGRAEGSGGMSQAGVVGDAERRSPQRRSECAEAGLTGEVDDSSSGGAVETTSHQRRDQGLVPAARPAMPPMRAANTAAAAGQEQRPASGGHVGWLRHEPSRQARRQRSLADGPSARWQSHQDRA